MLFILRFEDDCEKPKIRRRYSREHKHFLAVNNQTILIPGSLSNDASLPSDGALWIVQARDVSEVEEIYQSDPFWKNGLRKSVEIKVWNRTMPEGDV